MIIYIKEKGNNGEKKKHKTLITPLPFPPLSHPYKEQQHKELNLYDFVFLSY